MTSAPRRAGRGRRGLAQNATLAFLGDLTNKLGMLVVVVFTARLLSTPQYAALGVALAAAGILTAVLDGGVSVLLVRDGARSVERRGAIFVAALRGRLAVAAIAVAGAVAFAVVTGEAVLAMLAVAVAVVNALSMSTLALFRAAQDLRYEAVLKLLIGVGWPVAVAAAATLVEPSAAAVLASMGAVSLVSVLALLPFAPRVAAVSGPRASAFATLRSAAPLGLMALATLVYFRSGTLMLGAWGTSAETAAFTIASAVGFGLLLLPNAVTTGLLPRLSAELDPHVRAHVTRRALGWTLAICAGAAAITISGAPWALPLIVGERYESALGPLTILSATSLLIGASAVLGTALLAAHRTGVVGVQVALALVVNVAAGMLLIPRYGAYGAAWATVVTEVAALAFLLVAAVRYLPGLATAPRLRRHALVGRAALAEQD